MEKLQVLNKELRKEARTALRDRWGDAILTTLVYTGLYITISLCVWSICVASASRWQC